MKLVIGLLLTAIAVTSAREGETFDFNTINVKDIPTNTPTGAKGGGLNLGIGPVVYPSGSSSWNLDWDEGSEASGSGYSCDEVCPVDYEPLCESTGECTLSPTSASAEASEEGNTPAVCPDVCTAEYSPVTDDNGVEYSNKCMMLIAKCKTEKGKSDPTLVKSSKDPVEEATKTTKSTKSTKTSSNAGSSVGSLFDDGSLGVIGSNSLDADPTLVKGTKDPVEEATKTTKSTKSTKTSSNAGSSVGSLFDDGSLGVIGSNSLDADPTLVKGTKAPVVEATKTTKVIT
ncbi:hypothetical protein JM18_007924 [Phytophthora kernoviae]|uniref:Kazal-like domain-containing protein n=2 Tax=Phytophthora kernoviae TaxID=325452 RepID=A0A921SBE5_9STRA|nr:hypothetical protein G195_009598 [Phytophthora kernoviae 00238/432]KAG2516770.1 hypothetical protein JM18_007924 [Phytophthora kernoviae]